MNLQDKKDVSRYLGNPDQAYGVRRVTLEEGRAKGNTLYEVRTGAGLTYTLSADNGLDIVELSYKGQDLYYLSKNGHHSPYAYDAFETESMHNFPGGMVVTCGLMNVGGGNRDKDGVWHAMHGRFHSIPAVQTGGSVQNGALTVDGKIRETRLFGHALEVHRTVTSPVGEATVEWEDEISNLTPEPVDFMLLYHTNFGYPFLSPSLKMSVKDLVSTAPRTPYAEEHLDECFTFTDPVDGDDEQVFFHTAAPADGWACVTLENPTLGIGVRYSWKTDTLPLCAQWKCMRAGEYVLGIEPTNCHLLGRAGEQEAGSAAKIGAFETVKTHLKLSFYTL